MCVRAYACVGAGAYVRMCVCVCVCVCVRVCVMCNEGVKSNEQRVRGQAARERAGVHARKVSKRGELA